MLEQCLNKPVDEHMQVLVYVIRLCVAWLENK